MICPNCKKKFSNKITEQQTINVIELSKKGMSCREIAKKVGISFSSVSRITKQYWELKSFGVIK